MGGVEWLTQHVISSGMFLATVGSCQQCLQVRKPCHNQDRQLVPGVIHLCQLEGVHVYVSELERAKLRAYVMFLRLPG